MKLPVTVSLFCCLYSRDEDSDDDSNLLNGIHAERTKALEMDASDEDDLEDVDELYSSLSFNGARVNNLENKRSWTQRPLSMPRVSYMPTSAGGCIFVPWLTA